MMLLRALYCYICSRKLQCATQQGALYNAMVATGAILFYLSRTFFPDGVDPGKANHTAILVGLANLVLNRCRERCLGLSSHC